MIKTNKFSYINFCLFFCPSSREISSSLFLLKPIEIFPCALAKASLSSVPLVNKDSRSLLPSLIKFAVISIPDFVIAQSLSISLNLSCFFSRSWTLTAGSSNSCFLFSASSYLYNEWAWKTLIKCFLNLYFQRHLPCLKDFLTNLRASIVSSLVADPWIFRRWSLTEKPLSGSELPCERILKVRKIKDKI